MLLRADGRGLLLLYYCSSSSSSRFQVYVHCGVDCLQEINKRRKWQTPSEEEQRF